MRIERKTGIVRWVAKTVVRPGKRRCVLGLSSRLHGVGMRGQGFFALRKATTMKALCVCGFFYTWRDRGRFVEQRDAAGVQ